MATELLTELRGLAEHLELAATDGDSQTMEPLRAVMDAAGRIGKSWSGSNLGFHSRVYYVGLEPPPPGAHFDSEWGFQGMFQGTTGDWREFDFDEIVATVYELSGLENLHPQAALADEARALIEKTGPQVVSVLRAWLTRQEDVLISELCQEASKVKPMNERSAQTALVGQGGTKLIRDTTALSEGWQAAPHQVVEARVISIRSSFQSCEKLAQIATRAADHIARLELSQRATGQKPVAAGSNVFVGHGRSAAWRELKDFISERLGLPWDEFNRVPVAGVTNIARLSEMLDQAGIAFLVLTAEDETADGGERARQNVVHEAGLFQGASASPGRSSCSRTAARSSRTSRDSARFASPPGTSPLASRRSAECSSGRGSSTLPETTCAVMLRLARQEAPPVAKVSSASIRHPPRNRRASARRWS